MSKKGKVYGSNSTISGKARLNRRPLLIGFMILIAVTLIAFCGAYINNAKRDSHVQSSMEKYLQDKYGKEFIVEKPQRRASGFGVEGYFESVATPVHDGSLDFSVIYTEHSITDNYPGAVWSKSETSRLQPVIDSYFGSNLDFSVEIKTSGTLRGSLYIKGNIVPFGEAAKIYGHKIVYRLGIHTKDTIDDTNRGYIASKIHDFIKHEVNLDTDVIFVYSSTRGDREYGVALDGDDISRIESTADIEKTFKEW